MSEIKKSKSAGIAPIFIAIMGVIIVAIIGVIIFSVVKKEPEKPVETPVVEPVKEEMPKPIYEVIVGNVKFNSVEVEDMGSVLECEKRPIPPERCLPQDNANTTDKFIKVKITAQNMGQDNIIKGNWKVEELIDSEGRKFYSSTKTTKWIPEESRCGDLLKPNFKPTACIIIYEVSKHSIGLKTKVYAYTGPAKRGETPPEYFLDLNLYNEKYCWDDSDCACGINKYTKDCFLGNKTYVDLSDSSTYTPEMIEECDKFCAITTEGPTIKCINNECK